MEIRDKHAFSEAVDDLIAQNIEDRTERIATVHALTEAYTDSTGVRPDGAQLERLADYILREEISDPDPHKSTKYEYPILSDIQMERRRLGRRGSEGTNMAGETSIASDDTSDKHARSGVYLATDGRDYRNPIRRTRSIRELIFVDENAKIRNKKRAAQYKRDTAPGPVVSTPSEPFVMCRGIGAKIREWSGV